MTSHTSEIPVGRDAPDEPEPSNGLADVDGVDRSGPPPEGADPQGFTGWVRRVDDRVDTWFEPLRGTPAIDGLAKVITGAGDQGIMWAATTVWRARRAGPDRARAVRALAIAGIESTVVNRALKLAVDRTRPDPDGLELSAAGVPVRAPTSSSFPSGHTLAAFCAVTVMSQPGDPVGNTLLFGAASLVGLSRVHLRAHHASDVVGGAAIGLALGLIGRRFL
jgi:undecaprenyl-diphosphatase